jgi:EAL domain-containing protein (putative c-di-GMP-specific phosphodiesterase class I)
VRWIHPEKGFISPAEFIPIAEETGQIYAIEKWVIASALNQKLIFEKTGKNKINISINLSSKAFTSEINFYELESLFASYDVDYSYITIEITETAVISDMEFAVNKINKLRQLGMKIALDDFGTGYSSLTHLKFLPIDTLKLDKDFIKDIGSNYKDDMIIKAILNLSQDLSYEVIAEGIETEDQLEYLKKYKCPAGQGYLMSKAIPIDEVYQTINCSNKSSAG